MGTSTMKNTGSYLERVVAKGRNFATRKINDIRQDKGAGSLSDLKAKCASLLSARGGEILEIYVGSTQADKLLVSQFEI